jgi:peptide deformylase
MEIVTVDCPHADVLKKPTEKIKNDELLYAQDVVKHLILSLQPYQPAAGLAAPQIGISKAIFIFSPDRNPENLEAVINPHFVPLTDEVNVSWEACLSVLCSHGVWKAAKVPRYEKIKATYLNQDGATIERVLEKFAAKVFQHECDHLNGIVNIFREDAETQAFDSKGEMIAFMNQVKKEDALRYPSN